MNNNEKFNERKVEIDKRNIKITNTDLLVGTPIPPIERLKIISPNDFEHITEEWALFFAKKEFGYNEIYRCGGSGDLGRDIIAAYNYGEENLRWDNYQCKHYKEKLRPSDIWIEIGKICYYSFVGNYNLPQNYYFVSPLGVGDKLQKLLGDKNELKKQFLSNWSSQCEKKITKGTQIKLTKELEEYIQSIDFGIFKYKNPLDFINEYSSTPYYSYRFGGGLLLKKRPNASSPPKALTKSELVYTFKLFKAYEEVLKIPILKEEDLIVEEKLYKHFTRQRILYYQADSLMRYERDTIPPEFNAFGELKDEIFYSVIDLCDEKYSNGFEKVKVITKAARDTQIPNSNPLSNVLSNMDKHGICHHLCNEDRLDWVI